MSGTAVAWPRALRQYGTADTYQLAADWLHDCATVADWGGAQGFFGSFLPPTVQYTCVDGTPQADDQVLAELTTYHARSEGILLRHVLDNTPHWRPILVNALAAFSRRLVVVTFTPDAPITKVIVHKSGWPIWHFQPADLRAAMGDLLVRDEPVRTSHPERIYYLERRS